MEKQEEQKSPDVLITITQNAKGEFRVDSNIRSKYALLGYLDFAKTIISKDMLQPPAKVNEAVAPMSVVEDSGAEARS